MHNPIDPNTLGYLISDSARLLRALFERRIADAGLGLTPGEARTLIHVAAANGSRQMDIAYRMGVEPMTVCVFLDKLQGRDLIDRQPDPSDRRAKRILLTERSEHMLEALRQELDPLMALATQGMSDEMRTTLLQAMGVMRDNLQRADRLSRDT